MTDRPVCPAGIIIDRLSPKQARIWKAMERIVQAKDGAGRPAHPVLFELYTWAQASRVPIYVEMPEPRGRSPYRAGECSYEKQPDSPNSRLAGITIRLYVKVLDRALAKRRVTDRGFVPLEGLRGHQRYCESLAHELAHARLLMTDPGYRPLAEKLEILTQDLFRLLHGSPAGESGTPAEIRALAERLDLLSEKTEGPALAVEKEVWRELKASGYSGNLVKLKEEDGHKNP
jgi:hypothetical protein